jgi:hypothetical protein
VIDNFALGLIHLLLALAAWRLVLRPELDRDPADGDAGAEAEPRGRG